MLEVKPYKPKYKEALRMVCLNTAYPPASYERREYTYLLNTYCDYYLEQQPKNCFAAVDENDVAQGYILCCESYDQYKEQIVPYAKRAAATGFDHAFEGFCERQMYKLLAHKYPAHMHIDLNPGFQHQGAGSRMVAALMEHLEAKGVKGVMLIMGSGNENAYRFYTKNGFHKVLTISSATVMARTLGK